MSNDMGASLTGQATQASPGAASLSPPSGEYPSRFPGPRTDHNRCIGIVSPYGELWTWDTFESRGEAEKHLHDFWGSQAAEMMPGFKLCMVRVQIIPESEPFDLPSASAIEARSDATPKSDAAVGESAAPQEDAHD